MELNIPEYLKTKYWCKSYPKGLPSEITIPRVSLTEFIEGAIAENHGRVAMRYKGEEITFDSLGSRIGRFASALHALGVTKGETVALFLPNCPQFAIAYYGALKIGAMVTALSPLFMTPEVDFQLKDSGARALVIDADFWPRVESLLESLPLSHVIVVGEDMNGLSVPSPMGIHLFDDFVDSEAAPAPSVKID